MTNDSKSNPHQSARVVPPEWFKKNIMSKFKDWKPRLPVSVPLESKLEEYSDLKFELFRIQAASLEWPGTWAVGPGVLIQEMDMPDAGHVGLFIYDPPAEKPKGNFSSK